MTESVQPAVAPAEVKPTLSQKFGKWIVAACGLIAAGLGLVKLMDQFTLPGCDASRTTSTVRDIFKGKDVELVTLDQIKQLLSDHHGYPTSICRHPNPDPAIGWQRSVVSVVLEPAVGRMHLSRGNPCESPYEVYLLRA